VGKEVILYFAIWTAYKMVDFVQLNGRPTLRTLLFSRESNFKLAFHHTRYKMRILVCFRLYSFGISWEWVSHSPDGHFLTELGTWGQFLSTINTFIKDKLLVPEMGAKLGILCDRVVSIRQLTSCAGTVAAFPFPSLLLKWGLNDSANMAV